MSPRSEPQAAWRKRSSALAAGSLLQRKCACGPSATALTGRCDKCASTRLQRRLAVGATNDPLEVEADGIADRVMSTRPADTVNAPPFRIQRLSAVTSESAVAAPPSVDRVLASGGQPLDPPLRRNMEVRFGHDFSSIRVHHDVSAERSARDVGARAYTVGNHIVFGASAFAPTTNDGRRLLAHELTHTVQQGESSAQTPRLQRLACNFFVYDSTESSELGFAWKMAARSLARTSWGGYELPSGKDIEEMLERILSSYAEAGCDCIEELQFLSHGSSGNAMDIVGSGDELIASDFNIPEIEKYGDGPRSMPGYQDWHAKLTTRQRRLMLLRRILCGPEAEVYYRSCNAFQGKKGQDFAKASANFWRSNVIGHTKIIGVTQPGKKVITPGKEPDWSISEGVGETIPKLRTKPANTKPQKD
jgi:Domain of unknown function (DUF4157)